MNIQPYGYSYTRDIKSKLKAFFTTRKGWGTMGVPLPVNESEEEQ